MKLLITGINGFVGSNLVAALKEQHILYGLDIVPPQKEGVFNTFAWDELDKIPQVDVVIHLAGKAHDTKNRNDAQEYFNINVGLSQIIFQHFLESSATKFIFFSSIKAVADSVDGDQLTEEVLANPKTPYGKSKLEAENYLTARFHEWTKAREHDCTRTRGGEKTMGRLHDCMTRRGEYTTARLYDCTRGRSHDCTKGRKRENERGRRGEKTKPSRPTLWDGHTAERCLQEILKG